MSKQSNSVGGASFVNLLTILFIGLKLTGHINWSWIWVLSPVWIVFLIIVILSIIEQLIKR